MTPEGVKESRTIWLDNPKNIENTSKVKLIFNEGISQVGELLDLGVNYGFIDKAGAWYSYKGEKLGQGRENVKLLLKENVSLRDELEEAIREYYGIGKKEKKEEKKK